MTTRIKSLRGHAVLMMAHCAGMIDLVGLPVWVGTLITQYHFDPQQAGLLPSLFLGGAVVSSLFFAPRLNRFRARIAAAAGYGIAALAFALLSTTERYPWMALLHVLAGTAVGCGLSFTHGTIGRSFNPQRLFAFAGLAMGVFSIAFLGATPALITAFGGPALFRVLTIVMLGAALASALAFPDPELPREIICSSGQRNRLGKSAWFCMLGITSLALVQAMTFSFIEPIGLSHGFGASAIAFLFPTIGFVSLMPAPLAALFEPHVSPQRVLVMGSLLQGGLAIIITHTSAFGVFACAVTGFVSVMIFTHIFAFGVLAKLDMTGRAVAATPAMIMVGSTLGPIVGGTLAQTAGYPSIAIAALVFDLLAFGCFLRLNGFPRPQHRPA